MFDWRQLPKPIIGLSPMADLTDTPFCLMCKKYGAPVIFREMVSAEAIVRGNPKTLKMAQFDEGERPVIQQIFGSDPAAMARAAKLIEEKFHPDGIDINMGCPVYKITSNFDGAALIKDPERAGAIVKAVKSAVSVPVSVKTRLGWSRKDEIILKFLRILEWSGVDLVTVHGRTKEQGYSGKADWTAVGAARRAIPNIPFLVNGDIVDAASAKQALAESGADGCLIGRGALGNPWIFRELTEPVALPLILRGSWRELKSKERETKSGEVPLTERISVIREHARLQVEHYGERGLIKLRKHLPWYFSGHKNLRSKLVRINTLKELDEILDSIQTR